MTLTDLALRRAGTASLRDFQQKPGLAVTGVLNAQTEQALLPYLLGYTVVRVQGGDTFYRVGQRYGVSTARIAAANPNRDPRQLLIGQTLTVPYPFPVVPAAVPFSYRALCYAVRGLTMRYPELQEQVIGYTRQGRALPMLRFGSGPRVVLYNASHHANEWITTPVLLRFLEEYCLAKAESGRIGGVSAAELFRRVTLYVVPMVNPDGVELVTGELPTDDPAYRQAQQLASAYPQIAFPEGWKANLQGVDLNLNYPAGWEQARAIKAAQGYTGPAPRDFVGSAPLDQPETAAMVRITRELSPELTLSYHTQGRVIYWKYQDYNPAGAEKLGQRMAAASGYALELTPQSSGFAGYKDWYIQSYNRPGYTIECGLGQNPLPPEQFEEIYRANIGILLLGMQG